MTIDMFSSEAGLFPFSSPMSASCKYLKFLKPACSREFLVQFNGQPSIAKMPEAFSVASIMPVTLPPIPAKQNILPVPSVAIFLAARSVISPTSAAPEQAKIKFGPLLLSELLSWFTKVSAVQFPHYKARPK